VAGGAGGKADDVTLLMDLSRALVGLAVRSMGAIDGAVSLPQFRALTVLQRLGPCTAGDLAEGVGLHVSTITRLCDRLVEQALITREVRPENRRQVQLAITSSGSSLVQTVWSARADELNAALGGLSRAQRACLREVVGPVTLALRAAAGSGTDTAWW
jgi:DNA-binding MarR family transcriptional regulator